MEMYVTTGMAEELLILSYHPKFSLRKIPQRATIGAHHASNQGQIDG